MFKNNREINFKQPLRETETFLYFSSKILMEFNLNRFIEAQEHSYNIALNEIRNGRKESHWIWYIFPQEKGLGHSYNSRFYGLDGLDEAIAYWAHPILNARLREISEALLTHTGKDIHLIMGSRIDTVKLKSCMKLFNRVAPNDIFQKILDTFYPKRKEVTK